MDVDVDYCLKRFAEEQLAENLKLTARFERNLQKKRAKLDDTVADDEALLLKRESALVQQFSKGLIENNKSLQETHRTIEDLFERALKEIQFDVNTIAQLPLMRNDNQENIEEIRTANNKIRQQIARIDSELAQLFYLIDHNHLSNWSSRITSWFQSHYGYANELNRMVGKQTLEGNLIVFYETSPLMQSISDRIQLWNKRTKIIRLFFYELNETIANSEHLFNSFYHKIDSFTANKFIQNYIEKRQKERFYFEEQQLRQLESNLIQQSKFQQMIAMEIILILSQLTTDLTNEYSLNKKLKMALGQSPTTTSKAILPILTETNQDKQNLLFLLSLEIDYQKWISNKTLSIQQQFCKSLSKVLKIPVESIRIERIQDTNDQLQIIISSSIGQIVFQRILGHDRQKKTLLNNISIIQKCCNKFQTQLSSIVFGDLAFLAAKHFINSQTNRLHVHIHQKSSQNNVLFYSPDRINDPSLCPQGWKRFTINSSKTTNSWPILYLGIRNSFSSFILASSLPILSYRYLTYRNRETIYLSANIEHIAQSKFTSVWKKTLNDDDNDDGKNVYYQFILQCRINPKFEYFSNDKLECVIPSEHATLENICNNILCFGLMIRVTDVEPIPIERI